MESIIKFLSGLFCNHDNDIIGLEKRTHGFKHLPMTRYFTRCKICRREHEYRDCFKSTIERDLDYVEKYKRYIYKDQLHDYLDQCDLDETKEYLNKD